MAAEGGQATGRSHGLRLRSADGTQLAYRAWPHAGARITFAVVHGHGEHGGRYERFAQGMAAHGMSTYAVDLRGHGESPGQRGHVDSWTQWVEDAIAFVEHVKTETSGEVVPLGHSLGGVVMLSAIRSNKLGDAKRMVVSSPAVRLKASVPAWKTQLANITTRVTPRLAMSTGLDAAWISRIPEQVQAYRTDPLVHSRMSSRLYAEWQRAARENLEHAGQITVPFLILAGSADPLIDPAGSVELHERAPKTSELRMLEGRYHEPFNDLGSEEVFAMIAEWLGR